MCWEVRGALSCGGLGPSFESGSWSQGLGTCSALYAAWWKLSIAHKKTSKSPFKGHGVGLIISASRGAIEHESGRKSVP